MIKKISTLLFLGVLLAVSCSKDKDEEVSVTQSSEKDLITFTFRAATNEALNEDVTATIDQTAKTVSAKVPFGTALTALNPTITVSAKAAVGPTGAGNFSNAVIYTVTAENGSKAAYTVSVTVAENSEKELTSFAFLATSNTELDADVIATIDEEAKTVSATVPFGTDLTGLVPTIGFTAGAAIDPVAGATDFSSDVVYTITAMDASKATYTVSVTVAENSEKELTSFAFLATSNTELDADVIATIDEGAKTVSATVPFGTDLTDLTPTIGITPGAAIDPVAGPTDFSGPVVYTLTAEDGSQVEYTVTVIEQIQTDRQVLEDIFRSNPGNTLGITWEVDEPTSEISTWDRVKVDAEGRVVELDFEQSHISVLPASIGNLTQLEFLSLYRNNLNEIPASIGNLTQLEFLSLYRNNLNEIPSEIGNLTALTKLDLSENNLNEIPSDIGNLTALTDLVLYGNNLNEIPSEIGNLTALTYLDLSENNLNEIPSDIGNLTALTDLVLFENNLNEIPSEIGNLTALTYLYLSGTNLTTIPQKVCDLTLTGTIIFKDNGVTCE